MLKITTKDGMARVFSPYNAEFVSLIKGIGGRHWNSEEKCWEVPETEIQTVRQHMMDVFGETDLPTEGDRFTLRLTFTDDVCEKRQSVCLFGKEIARAWGRDSGAKIGDDAVYIEGKMPTSGGSMKNWCTVIPEGCVIKVRNVTEVAYAAQEEKGFDGFDVERVEEQAVDRLALLEEKEKLTARLAEIERLLSEE